MSDKKENRGRHKKWLEGDITLLRVYYPSEGSSCRDRLLGSFTDAAIRAKARELEIRCSNLSEEHKRSLSKAHKGKKLSLPHKKAISRTLRIRACRLGLPTAFVGPLLPCREPQEAWSEDDVQILRDYYPTQGTKCASKLSVSRSMDAIRQKVCQLGIRANLSICHKGRTLSLNTKLKISKAHKGVKLSAMHRKQISLAQKGKKLSKEHIEKVRKANLGRKRSEASKLRMREAAKNRKKPPPMSAATREKFRLRMLGSRNHNYGKHPSEDTKRKISEKVKGVPRYNRRGKTVSKEARLRMSRAQKGIHKGKPKKWFAADVEVLREYYPTEGSACQGRFSRPFTNGAIRAKAEGLGIKADLSAIRKASWGDLETKNRKLKALFAGARVKPNKPERFLSSILGKLFPGEFKYVGDGKVVIEGRCPDFVNVNGKKQIIEHFGTYWHGLKRTGRSNAQEEALKVAHYAKYGYSTLIIWEHELKNEVALRQKISKFVGDAQ